MTRSCSRASESSLNPALRERLDELRGRDLYRRRRVVQEWSQEDAGVVASVDGARRVVFCSNDYLGLSHHPRVVAALRDAAARYGVGSGASHLVTGHGIEHHALEEEVAAFTGRERALLFSTGYMANLGIAAALVERGDQVLEDRLNHASLLDAALLSGARLSRYAHCDATAVAAKLAEPREGATLVMTDGVFSMDGDVAPLSALASAAQSSGALLMVDDAHGIGVLGARGRGTLEHFGLDAGRVPILMGTFGKALGTCGAFVAGAEELIEYLIQRSRTYIYTTALPPAIACATRTALRLIDEESWRRDRLLANIARFRSAVHQAGIELSSSATPIQPIVLGSAARAVAVSEALWERGFWVTAIRPPTVPEGTARLRITLSAAHHDDHIDSLVDALTHALRGTS
ncbi:MAG TPA: 8-amino-7-oxononanoate synthase [Steroidobacteraceae bacterium]|nr:8-amino-7-oxononanoate synthase [Steroidobacteraceae bacterium]